MSKRKKRLEKIRRNPKNVRRDEIDTLLLEYGFERGVMRGSHLTYRHSTGIRITIAPHGSTVAVYSVKQAISAIDELKLQEDETKVDTEVDDDGKDT